MDKEQIEAMFDLLEDIKDIVSGKTTKSDDYEPPTEENSSSCEKCGGTEYWVNESKSEKNPGRHFKKCRKKECGNFMGWTTESITVVKK